MLDEGEWAELGIDIGRTGAPCFHDLLSVWVYGFMTGVRSSRKWAVGSRMSTGSRDAVEILQGPSAGDEKAVRADGAHRLRMKLVRLAGGGRHEGRGERAREEMRRDWVSCWRWLEGAIRVEAQNEGGDGGHIMTHRHIYPKS